MITGGSEPRHGLVKFTVYALATANPVSTFQYAVLTGWGTVVQSSGPRRKLGISCRPLMTFLNVPFYLLVFNGTVPTNEFDAIRAEYFSRIGWYSREPWLAMTRQLPFGSAGFEAAREQSKEAEIVEIYASDTISQRPKKKPIGKARVRVRE